MGDVLEQSSAWLEAQRTKHRTRPVTYRRGQQSVALPATVGKTTFELDDAGGAVLRVQSRDFLVLARDLTLGLPRRGDTIVEPAGSGQALVYEVSAPGNEPCWRYADPYRRTLRVHTKQVDTQEAS